MSHIRDKIHECGRGSYRGDYRLVPRSKSVRFIFIAINSHIDYLSSPQRSKSERYYGLTPSSDESISLTFPLLDIGQFRYKID